MESLGDALPLIITRLCEPKEASYNLIKKYLEQHFPSFNIESRYGAFTWKDDTHPRTVSLAAEILVTFVHPQARRPEDSPGEGSRKRTAGANHWERSQRDLPGEALTLFLLIFFVPHLPFQMTGST